MTRIFGVTQLEYLVSPSTIPTVRLELAVGDEFNPRSLYDLGSWDEFFPGNVIVKCQWCKQWGARRTQCRHCGGAIE